MSTPPQTAPTTAGIIYPDHAAEDEYPWAADLLGVQLPVVHVYGTDLHAVPELLDLGRPDRLADGAARLAAQLGTGGAVARPRSPSQDGILSGAIR